MTRPRLLWVTEEVPDLDGGGGGVRQANLLIGLASRFEVCVLVAAELTDLAVRAAVEQVIEVHPDPGRPRRLPANLHTAWDLWVRRRGLSVAGSHQAVQALAPAVRARHRDHDVVVLNHENLLPLLPVLAGTGGPLLVAHLFDVKSLVARQALAVAPNRRQAVMWRADARLMERLEVEALRAVDLVVTCSSEDQAALDGLAPHDRRARSVIVPNGVDLDRFAPTPAAGGQRVLFFGSLDYMPNVDGVRWFVEGAWPLVRQSVPDAQLSIVGRRPVVEVLELAAAPGVEVIGEVPDAPPWFAASDVAVVPLRIGTGTRLKALEAMACGRPVVGTTIGLEGLDLGAAEPSPASVADDARGLSAAVVALLRDPAAAHRQGEAGRRHVSARFGWTALAASMGDELELALAAVAPGGDR